MTDYDWFFKRPKRHNPKDKKQYLVTNEVINYTTRILRQYGSYLDPAEGLVYWAGNVLDDVFNITAAVAPKTDVSRHGIKTSNQSNAKFVEFICDHGLEYIAQVHSHPGKWVDHSGVDNEETAFRSEGLVSIVVPCFGNEGMLPFTNCGIHRFVEGKFIRLNKLYIKQHFSVTQNPTNSTILKDLRNE